LALQWRDELLYEDSDEFFSRHEDYFNSFHSHYYEESILNHTNQVTSLPTIQNLTSTGLGGHHLILAVLIILKHATFLRLSKQSESALIQAELDYQKANIDSTIQEHLNASSTEVSIENFAGFIMATNIMPSGNIIESSSKSSRNQFLQSLLSKFVAKLGRSNVK